MSEITKEQIASMIDHTMLKVGEVIWKLIPQAFATESDIEKLCNEANKYGFASVCVNPMYIQRYMMTMQLCFIRIYNAS